MVALKIVGGILIAFGLVDMIGSFTGLDVWGDWIGVTLPQAIWSFTAYIEIAIGYALFNIASRANASSEETSVPTEESNAPTEED